MAGPVLLLIRLDGPGHTPDKKHIQSRCNAEVLIIDTGISSYYGGRLSALEVQYELYSDPSSSDSGTTRGFVELETVVAIYPDQRQVLDQREARVTFDTSKKAIQN